MKIAEIRIKGFQQFKDITLDFTDPNGKPLDKICFIGRNGTGKSTILDLLNAYINDIEYSILKYPRPHSLAIKFYANNKLLYGFYSGINNKGYVFPDEVFIKATEFCHFRKRLNL